jgi:hypothetical protein
VRASPGSAWALNVFPAILAPLVAGLEFTQFAEVLTGTMKKPPLIGVAFP